MCKEICIGTDKFCCVVVVLIALAIIMGAYVVSRDCFKCRGFWIGLIIALLGVICAICCLVCCKCSAKYISSKNAVIVPNGNESEFAKHKNLKFVYFSKEDATLEPRQFLGCDKVEHILLPSKLKTIPDYAFACCSSLKKLEIPETVETIEEYAFLGCSTLEEIRIPAKKIGKYAFADCTKLKEIKLQKNFKIDEKAFYGCDALNLIRFEYDKENFDKNILKDYEKWGISGETKIAFSGSGDKTETITQFLERLEKEPESGTK